MNEDNKNDALKEIFRRKLESHQIPVDSSDWVVINNRLTGKSLSKKKLIVMWSAVAASVAILIGLAYLFSNKESDSFSKNPILAEQPYEYWKPTNAQPAPALDSISRETIFPPTHESQINKNDYDNNEQKDVKESPASEEPERIVIPRKQPEKPLTAQQTGQPQHPVYAKKEKKELLLTASFHTNSGIGNNTIIQPPLYGANAPGDYAYLRSDISNNALIAENTDGEYFAPLSFGLTIQKNISARWGIETGLVYTYLSGTYRWNDFVAFDASQQLHYLGIPVNGMVHLWNNHPKWNVYFSAGAMLEKGLWMKTVRNQHFPDHVITTTQKSNINGWQWSLNTSVGISYRFANKMKLYVEPRLGYYFDNDQPMSIRTDRPVSVGIGAGLQYTL